MTAELIDLVQYVRDRKCCGDRLDRVQDMQSSRSYPGREIFGCQWRKQTSVHHTRTT